jgi:hypothetical protein
VPQTDE